MGQQDRPTPIGLDAYLQYRVMLEPGVMLLKNGSYLAGFLYRGPDLESATVADAEWLSASFNNAVKTLDEGWMLHQVVVRVPSSGYPEGFFSEPTNALIDGERMTQFSKEGAHYESFSYLFLTYMPPMHARGGFMKKLGDFMMGRDDDDVSYIERDIKRFNEMIARFQTSFSQTVRFSRLTYEPATNCDELLGAINMILNSKKHPCRLPNPPSDLDSWLARDLENGNFLVYDGRIVAILSIDGFPSYSYPGILADVEKMPIDMVWSSRFIVTDQQYARNKINSDRRKWQQKVYPFTAAMMNTPAPPDQYALQMVKELESAQSLIEQGSIIYGHYTSTVMLKGDDEETVNRGVREITKIFERLAFPIRLERRNALEAFLGSLPGHGRENVRKPYLHSLNFADLAPLSHEWSGSEFCPSPPPHFPPNSPALMQAATIGTTPFRVNLYVDDVGHTLILGPTGAGKSTLLATLVSQFERYKNSQVFVFDKGMSMFALTASCLDAAHYDLGALAEAGGFCPLADLDSQEDRGWACEFLDALLKLQLEDNPGDHLGAEDRSLVREAVNILADSTSKSEDRTITAYISTVQSEKVRRLLSYYQIGGGAAGNFVDGRKNDIKYKSLVTFEMEELMQYGKNIVGPVLLFLFRQIEKRLTGRPTMLVIDEAWLALGNPVFSGKIKEWLKVLRKANCAVVMATQNVSDIAESAITSALVESCPTKIFLPNPEARTEHSAELYKRIFGLNDRQVALIAGATRKRHYYFANPMGRKLFELGLGPVALSFVGAGAKEDIARIKVLRDEHGAEWPKYWLGERGLPGAAEGWSSGYRAKEHKPS